MPLNYAAHGPFASGYGNLSALDNRKADFSKARECADAALRLNPKSDGAWFQQAKARESQGRLDDAVDALNRGISSNPRASAYYYVLARIYRRLGKMDESRKALESFTRLDKETNHIEEIRRRLRTRSTDPAQPATQRN